LLTLHPVSHYARIPAVGGVGAIVLKQIVNYHLNMPKHLCPRCGGTEMYLGHGEKTTGVGGIYGRKTHQIRIPLCKECTAQMDVIWEKGEHPYVKFFKIYLKVAAFVVVGGVLFVLGFAIWDNLNS